MWIRILSALLAIPLLVYILYTGGAVLTTALAIVNLIALREFFNVFKRVDIFPFQAEGLLSSVAMVIMIGIYGEKALQFVIAVIMICTILCFAKMLLQKKARVIDLGITLLGMVYISLLMNMLLLIYSLEMGYIYIWLVFVLAWLGDTFAYFIGISFGRHKLCPTISPKKSVEGAVGGLLGSISGSVIFGYIIWRLYGISFDITGFAIVGAIGGILAQLGDLTASIIKRYTGVKDYGNIMPGHGGILDRFDSVLFTIPVVYYYIGYFL